MIQHMVSAHDETVQWQGKLYIIQAFDVGDDIQLNKIAQEKLLPIIPGYQAKYFKNYHMPLSIAPDHESGAHTPSTIQIYNFGVISLRYEVPFSVTIDELKRLMIDSDAHYQSQSVQDAYQIFQKIKATIKQPSFFNVRTSYTIIQILPQPHVDVVSFQQIYGSSIASALRFETETLSDYQKNDILAGAFGYYRGDVVMVDLEAAFLYDDDLVDTIELFEFAQVQHLELQFF